jgi:hypothetical protein
MDQEQEASHAHFRDQDDRAPRSYSDFRETAIEEVFKEAVAEKPGGRFMIRCRSRTRVVKRNPEGDW